MSLNPTNATFLQRAKIDFRDVAWSDFKGKAPAEHTAVTFSDIEKLPKKVKHHSSQEASGTECMNGTKAGTEFKATISVDPVSFDNLKSYMDQKKSGANADYKKGLVDRTKTVVKECTKHFADQEGEALASAGKSCLDHVEPCKQTFRDGNDPFELEIGKTKVVVKDVKDCSKTLPKDCKNAHMAETEWGEFSFGDITAKNKAACSAGFKTEVATANQTESARLLAHEQLHFNITNSFAIELKEKLRELAETLQVEETACGKKAAIAKAKEAFAAQDVQAKFQALWDERRAENETTQDAYDDETDHGMKSDTQASWDARFPKKAAP